MTTNPERQAEPVAAEQLLPCPLCEGEAEYTSNPMFGDQTIAQCIRCGCSAYYRKWNTRSTHQPAASEEPVALYAHPPAQAQPSDDVREAVRALLAHYNHQKAMNLGGGYEISSKLRQEFVEAIAALTTAKPQESDEVLVERVKDAIRNHMNVHGPICTNNLARAIIAEIRKDRQL